MASCLEAGSGNFLNVGYFFQHSPVDFFTITLYSDVIPAFIKE